MSEEASGAGVETAGTETGCTAGVKGVAGTGFGAGGTIFFGAGITGAEDVVDMFVAG